MELLHQRVIKRSKDGIVQSDELTQVEYEKEMVPIMQEIIHRNDQEDGSTEQNQNSFLVSVGTLNGIAIIFQGWIRTGQGVQLS